MYDYYWILDKQHSWDSAFVPSMVFAMVWFLGAWYIGLYLFRLFFWFLPFLRKGSIKRGFLQVVGLGLVLPGIIFALAPFRPDPDITMKTAYAQFGVQAPTTNCFDGTKDIDWCGEHSFTPQNAKYYRDVDLVGPQGQPVGVEIETKFSEGLFRGSSHTNIFVRVRDLNTNEWIHCAECGRRTDL